MDVDRGLGVGVFINAKTAKYGINNVLMLASYTGGR